MRRCPDSTIGGRHRDEDKGRPELLEPTSRACVKTVKRSMLQTALTTASFLKHEYSRQLNRSLS